jgi:AraC-like DNA-binding protein
LFQVFAAPHTIAVHTGKKAFHASIWTNRRIPKNAPVPESIFVRLSINENLTALENHQHIPTEAPYNGMIHAIWQVKGYTPFREEHIVPKGIVELIFNLNGGQLSARIGDRPYQINQAFINGFNTSTIHFQLPEHLQLFGIQLHPLMVKKLLKVPASEFSNTLIDLHLLDPGFNLLWEELMNRTAFEDRVRVIYRWLQARIREADTREAWINRFLIHAEPAGITVGELAQRFCYSTRQLSRRLSEATGLNTEELILYKKYLHAIHLMHHTDLPLTSIAYESHFSDQSHFIRSFKAFTQLTPRAYQTVKSPLKGHLYEHVR